MVVALSLLQFSSSNPNVSLSLGSETHSHCPLTLFVKNSGPSSASAWGCCEFHGLWSQCSCAGPSLWVRGCHFISTTASHTLTGTIDSSKCKDSVHANAQPELSCRTQCSRVPTRPAAWTANLLCSCCCCCQVSYYYPSPKNLKWAVVQIHESLGWWLCNSMKTQDDSSANSWKLGMTLSTRIAFFCQFVQFLLLDPGQRE
jgi:hypothetical protein